MPRVLIAGATGYLGRFVVREFHNRGYQVRVLARNPDKLNQVGPHLEPAVADCIDEIFKGEITRLETLEGICDQIDIVFSSVGITRQKDKLTYRDVDYQGNVNLLNIAGAHAVKTFIYVSVFNAHLFEHLEIVKAHEDFVRELQQSGLDHAVIRPTGYFSDMSEFLKMAMSGRVYQIGNGDNKINPIHGADLAKVCVDVVNSDEKEKPIGGPVEYSASEIARLAFRTLGREPHVTRIPPWLAKGAVKLIRPFNRQLSDLAEFMVAAGTGDGLAPKTGEHHLETYYQELASSWIGRK